MDIDSVTTGLAALSQTSRLEAFRLLVRHEPSGLPAGEVSRELAVPQNTMSAHLSVLAHVGLVTSQRQGRSIIYRADLERLRALMMFLVKDCCDGSPALCEPLIAELSCCG